MSIGVKFNEIHSEKDLGLKLINVLLDMPNVKEQRIDIPFGDGSVDLTEMFGRPTYKDRNIQLELVSLSEDYDTWFQKYSQIAKQIHGKKVKLIFDNQPDVYYMARLELKSSKEYRDFSKVVFSGLAEPFKADCVASSEAWIWDSFNFKNGVIRNLKDIVIDAAHNSVTILGGDIDSAPIFHVVESKNLRLLHNDREYVLNNGWNKFPSVRIGEQDMTLQFSGSGKLSIEYRKVCL